MARLAGISGVTKTGGSRTTSSTPDTITTTDYLVRVSEAAAFVVNLPAISSSTRLHTFVIKKVNATANVTVTPDGADTILGSATFVLTTQNQSVTVFCPDTGTSWDVI
jgi:hypothetical protein